MHVLFICLLALFLFYAVLKIIKEPVYGIYFAFISSGILETVNLGPLRDKVGLTELIFTVTWLSMLLSQRWRERRIQFSNLQKITLWLMFAFVIIQWLSLFINNMDFYGGLIGSIVEVSNITYGFLMSLTLVILVNDHTKLFNCLKFWTLGAFIVSLVACWALTGTAPEWTVDEFTGRVSSTLKFENQIPSYLVPILIPMLTALFVKGINKYYKLFLSIVVVLSCVTMISTGSRTAFLMLVISIFAVFSVGFVSLSNVSLFKGKFILGVVALFFSISSYIVIALAAFDGNYALGHTPSWQRPVVRLYISLADGAALDSTRQHQLSVVYENADKAMLIGNGPKLYGRKFNIEEIHNTYVGVLFETGLIGLTLFLTLLLFVIYCAISTLNFIPKNTERILVLSFISGFLVLLLYSLTMYGLRQRPIWLMMGLLICLPSIYKRCK